MDSGFTRIQNDYEQALKPAVVGKVKGLVDLRKSAELSVNTERINGTGASKKITQLVHIIKIAVFSTKLLPGIS
jgi:hypothetical protein